MTRRAVHTITIIFLVFAFSVCLPVHAKKVDKKGTSAKTGKDHQTIAKVTLRELFEKDLCLRLEKETSDVMVSRFKVVGNEAVPQGGLHFQFLQKGTGRRRPIGYVRAIALISVDGVVRNRAKLSGWVDVFEPVVCTARNVKRGEIIQRDDLCLIRKNISHLSPKILRDMSRAIGYMAKHNVREGACLKEWMVGKPSIVKKGDMVTIVAESDELRLTVPGRVLGKGYRGELVKIRNVMSKKEIYARVVNNSTVVIDF